ncbi:hypothetical protein [Streptomyces hydrogenans]|uniref:hypothetical protein n=1 Tax=Streptomyces hydrogenans TaxID=1873719 RepID=UPI0037FEFC74
MALAGTSVQGVALPVVAVQVLGASPGQVSLLAAAATAPAFFFALPAGVVGTATRSGRSWSAPILPRPRWWLWCRSAGPPVSCPCPSSIRSHCCWGR